MKIIHLITTIERGGAEIQLLELCKSQKVKNYTILVAYLKGNPTLKSSFESIGVQTLKLMNLRSWIRVWKFSRGFTGEHEHIPIHPVIHAHLPRAELAGLCLSVILNLKLIVSKHNCEIMWPNGSKRLSHVLARLVGIRASAIVCISNSVKQFLVDGEEIDADMEKKTFVVHYGIDLENIPATRDIDLTSKNHIQVGTLSRLEEQKDLPTLIAAVKMVTERYSNVKLVIHGEGSKREALMELRSKLSLERSVEILGKTDQVEDFFTNCDIFVLTSKYEGFGLVLLESMYYSTPLLASNSTAALEVLKGSENLLFQIGDAKELANKIVALIECPNIVEKNVESCRRILHCYDISIARDEIEKLYV